MPAFSVGTAYCIHAPREAAAVRSAGAVHTLSLAPVSPREHKVIAGHDNVADMARGLEAARRCEIVANTTRLTKSSAGGRASKTGQRQFQNICM